MSKYFIGIDPQPSNISVCVLDEEANVLKWLAICLFKRTTFLTATDWQKYIIEQCQNIVYEDLKEYITEATNVSIGVEQQRGRINSIIEQTLLTIFFEKFKGSTIFSIHPKKWKRIISFNPVGNNTNRNHKQHSVNMVHTILLNYCKENDIVTPTGRIHDLCDAYLISKALIKSS
jgi:hypothetical protein